MNPSELKAEIIYLIDQMNEERQFDLIFGLASGYHIYDSPLPLNSGTKCMKAIIKFANEILNKPVDY